MRYLLILLAFFIVSNLFADNPEILNQRECVVLMHGLGDVKLSMLKIKKTLEDSEYKTFNIGYTTSNKTIESIAENKLSHKIKNISKKYEKVHFVTHSMGGLILRYYLQENSIPTGSRIVMLSPPNKGSEIANHFKDSPFYQLILGEVGQQLATDSKVIKKLKGIKPDIGIITGDTSANPYFSKIIPGKDDGRVSVNNAKLKEMNDFLIVSSTHLSIKYNNEVMRQIVFFIENGTFDHSKK